MTLVSQILNGKLSLVCITLTLLICLVAGVSSALFPEETLFISLSISLILFALISNKLFDLLLWTCFFAFLLAQFLIPVFEMMRFVFLLLLGLLSAYLIQGQRFALNPVAVGIVLLAFYAMVTSPLSYAPTVSLLKSVSVFLLGGFLLFVPPAIQLLHPRVGAGEYMLRVYSYFAIVIVISNAVYYLIMPSSSNEIFSGTSFSMGRYRGWFVNPNDLATLYGVFFVPILWSEAGKQKMGLAKIGLLSFFLLAAIELLATQSRAGILAGIVSLLVLVLGGEKRSSRIPIMAVIVLLIGTIYLENPDGNFVRSFIYRNEVQLAGSGRLSYWAAAWNRFLVKPVFGSGLGISNSGTDTHGLVFSSQAYTIIKDNSYLKALEELGIVGCIVLVATLLVPVSNACWKGLISANLLQHKSNLIFVAIVAAGLFNAVFESWLLSAGNLFGVSFWIFASLLMMSSEEE